MKDFESSTLWRISSFERLQSDEAQLRGAADRPTLLSSTMLSELGRLEHSGSRSGADVIDVLAACMRHRESALLYLRNGDHVWPVTLFPNEFLYHCPRDLLGTCGHALGEFTVLSVEPPGVRPPGHLMHDRVAAEARYRPLLPLLWTFALHGPRSELLPEIGGAAAYRVAPGFQLYSLTLPGASQRAFEALRVEAESLRAIAQRSGMNLHRARRLINALYLVSGLMVLRSHRAARQEPGTEPVWFNWLRKR